MTYALQLKGVDKSYGSHVALSNFSMHVPAGSTYGFVGGNGAGKTTTFSIIGGFIFKDAGEIQCTSSFGLLPQDARFSYGRTVHSELTLLAHLAGVSTHHIKKEIQRVLTLVGLLDKEHTAIQGLSHGMYKRLGIAQALLGSPELLLLDEPTAGLDPQVASEIRALISTLKEKHTVVISSHNLHELSHLCTHIGIIHQGQMISEGPIEELVGSAHTLRYQLKGAFHAQRHLDHHGILEVTTPSPEEVIIRFDQEHLSTGEMNKYVFEMCTKHSCEILAIIPGTSFEEEILSRIQNFSPSK